MKLSVSSYSFQQYLNQGKLTWEELPKIAHEIGFDAIEYIDLPGATQEEKLALAKKIKQNRPMPQFFRQMTGIRHIANPMRRHWRRRKLNI